MDSSYFKVALRKSWFFFTVGAISFPGGIFSKNEAKGGIKEFSQLHKGLSDFVPFVSPINFSSFLISEDSQTASIKLFCQNLNKQYAQYPWDKDPCGPVAWQASLKTSQNNPLLYATFGKGSVVTILLGGVHPDEITPIPIAFRFARYLHDNPNALPANAKVIIAPLVNPDGFFKKNPVRINSNGIDLNRNFFTLDWFEKAHALWDERRKKIASHFPGHIPNSEIETIFQIQLIDTFKPQKIMSIHSPLGFLDYDGPGDGERPGAVTDFDKKAQELVLAVSQKSRNYRVVDYRFYPGSLGNYAGHERMIPTITLELESTDPRKIESYWKQFLPGIMESIHYPLPKSNSMESLQMTPNMNASPFSIQYPLNGIKKTI